MRSRKRLDRTAHAAKEVGLRLAYSVKTNPD